jgi:acetoin utilization deacetylase AcuC-like enzyme
MTGFVYEEKYLRHTLEKNHPESPERLRAIMRRMKASGLDKKVKPINATVDPDPWIRAVHPEAHIKLADRQARDSSICRLSVSGALSAVDAVCGAKVRNAFCALRPPGHHATNTGEYGFCFFNNVAVAARYARTKHKLARVLIVDWDYHHGNGTEWAFYEDPTVLFFSTHRLAAFPGTGFAERTGKGKGLDLNINVPLERGAGDREILGAFEKQMKPAADNFKPDIVLISAGFDSRKDDLLGDFAVTDDGFAKLTALMMSIADSHCKGRLVSLLEGGYNTEGLAMAVESHVGTLQKAPGK